ncbi:MAG: protoporphyrinogen oxidase [Elusimicrobia bacterium]|nr:protoporphyrinogen oxidase [Elusimicrobiota bacterium]
MKKAVVVGGGIAGLAAAYRLIRLRDQHGLELEVTLLEGSERLGGKIKTDRSAGVVIEAGPDSFLTAKPDAVVLARELGLESRLLPTATEGKDVYVWLRGRLRRLPEGLMLMAPTRALPFLMSDLMSFPGKLRMGLERFLPRGGSGDESLAAFTRRRLGREALEAIVDPLMAGIYAGDSEAMSLQSTFPQFVVMERRYGSVIRGLRAGAKGRPPAPAGPKLTPFASFMGGVEELVEALGRGLGEAKVRTGARVTDVRRAGARWRISGAGEDLEADAVILALPAADAANALEREAPGMSAVLRQIQAVSTATVTMGFDRKDLGALPPGFGFVAPKSSGRLVNAATFVSQKFPQRRTELFMIRCFVGGAGKEADLEASDAVLLERALADLKLILGLSAVPKVHRVYRWNRANPQYTVGHQGRLRELEGFLAGLPGLALIGASYYGVGIPDCIRSANETAAASVKWLKTQI